MRILETEQQQRRLKKKRKRWPKWLRTPFLIRWVFLLGPILFRLWRLYQAVRDLLNG